jgi:hypothetical protein
VNAEAPEKIKLPEKKPLTAHVTLKDGRVLDVPGNLLPPRPRLELMSKVIEPSASPIHLDSPDDLPVDARLHFRLKSQEPDEFGKQEQVEVASADGFFNASLTLENGGLIRQNSHTVVATLEITKSFGASFFGALRFRPVSEEGYRGDWQPLATLVRLPELAELHCPAEKDEPCTLSGNNLFLIDSVASDAQFEHATQVSENLMEMKLGVPRPKGKILYLKLRDDPTAVNTLEMPIKKDAAAVSKEVSAEKSKEEKSAAKEDKSAAHPREKSASAAKTEGDQDPPQ